ncbi:LysR family transcriptional regulator [Parendozoicomonas haliclonae]|uniref:Nodulation protein D 2 n=1 Tax=Parendozoicomonas haliclonae TaxID=1960125 RepID=A0A1X7AFV2_9GAMM|nr:LysR family transcriptional regulator [Parendozoicomonas haliclonae]SMA37581.1 Nodulation protein D 2 [Parendozoicomonas haliclonae]
MKSSSLHLLRTFQVLIEECHVTNAAERLHITQSGVSRQLTQLRELFHDQLLIREGNKLLPTPRAIQLKFKIDCLLNDFENLIEPELFDHKSWEDKFVFSSSDHIAQFFMPELVKKLSIEAPMLDIIYRLWSQTEISKLIERDIHLVSTMLPDIPSGLCGTLIGEDLPVCVMSKSHPLALKQKISCREYCSYSHVSVTGGGDKDSFVDISLSAHGLKRRIQFSVPFFTSALETVSQSEMLLTIPMHIAHGMREKYPITYSPLPIHVPNHKYWLIWHPKYDTSPSHRWFREFVLQVMQNSICLSKMANHQACT